MKKYIVYAVACLVLVGMFSSCTADEMDTQKNPIDNAKGFYLGGGSEPGGIDPIRPNLPKP